MANLGAQGFPGLALERNGQLTLLDVSAYLGEPQKLRDWLAAQSSNLPLLPRALLI